MCATNWRARSACSGRRGAGGSLVSPCLIQSPQTRLPAPCCARSMPSCSRCSRARCRCCWHAANARRLQAPGPCRAASSIPGKTPTRRPAPCACCRRRQACARPTWSSWPPSPARRATRAAGRWRWCTAPWCRPSGCRAWVKVCAWLRWTACRRCPSTMATSCARRWNGCAARASIRRCPCTCAASSSRCHSCRWSTRRCWASRSTK